MNNHQHPPQCIHSQRDKTLFVDGIGVFDRHGRYIPKRLFCVREAHTMLAMIGSSLGRVELELHAAIMHI